MSRVVSSKSSTILPIVFKLNSEFKVILGSTSPRRKELLAQMGFEAFNVHASNFAEDLDHSLYPIPSQYCLATASKKVESVVEAVGQLTEKTLIIGSDTIVEIDGKILEKPTDAFDSANMLSLLNNRDHFVHTAVVAYANSVDLNSTNHASTMKPIISFVETTKVTFCDLSESDIAAYVELGEGMDKAGSYGIQGAGSVLVRSIEGCYFNVMGLPVHALSRELAKAFAGQV